jgi:hypothetical protein
MDVCEQGRADLDARISSLFTKAKEPSLSEMINSSKRPPPDSVDEDSPDRLKEQQSKEFQEQHDELAAQLLQITVNDKITVMFNVNDPIFHLRVALSSEDFEDVEEWSRCNCCGDANSKKLKNCHFCGSLNCAPCLNHQRHFCVDNKDRSRLSTQVCITCNAKFLYRDAMYELMGRLTLRDEEIKLS